MFNYRLWEKKSRMQSGANVTAQFMNNKKKTWVIYIKQRVFIKEI